MIDLNEIASNAIVALAVAAFSAIGNSVGKLIAKANKAEKDLQALWPRFRELENKVKEWEYDVGEFTDPDRSEVTYSVFASKGDSSVTVRAEQEDGGDQVGRSDRSGGG